MPLTCCAVRQQAVMGAYSRQGIFACRCWDFGSRRQRGQIIADNFRVGVVGAQQPIPLGEDPLVQHEPVADCGSRWHQACSKALPGCLLSASRPCQARPLLTALVARCAGKVASEEGHRPGPLRLPGEDRQSMSSVP